MQTLLLTPYSNQLFGYNSNNQVLCLCDATLSTFDIDLPDSEGVENNTFVIKKTDNSAHEITLIAKHGQTIDGQESFTLTAQNEAVTINVHDGNYYITGYYAG